MKETTKEIKREVVDTRTVYVADDGKEFWDKEQCKAYEESALYAVGKALMDSCMQRINDVIASKTIDQFIDVGFNRGAYFYLKLKTEQDKENLARYTYIMEAHNKYYFLGTSKWWDEHKDYARMCLTLEEVELDKEYILFVNEDCESFGIYSKEHFVTVFKKSWDDAVKSTK